MSRFGKLFLALAVTLTVVPTGARAASSLSGRQVPDSSADGAVDLRTARIAQDGPDITVWLGLGAAPDPARLSAAKGGRVCVWFESGERRRSFCASTNGHTWPEQANADGVELIRSGERRIGLRFVAESASPVPGVLKWWVVARAAECDAKVAEPCLDRLPDKGGSVGRVYEARVSGCKATGPVEVSSGPRGRPRIALTFDDGPSAYTRSIAAVLERHRARGTFFLLGSQVAARGPAQPRRLLAAGHELGNHSFTHPMLGAGGPRATAEMRRTSERIRKATGFTPCLFRPPYGDRGADLTRRARALGMTSVVWDVDTNDYQRRGAASIAGIVLSQVRSGSIVLMHDGGGERSQTVAAVRDIVPRLAKRYELVTVSELLGYRTTYRLVR